jgi:hypothetical protein
VIARPELIGDLESLTLYAIILAAAVRAGWTIWTRRP